MAEAVEGAEVEAGAGAGAGAKGGEDKSFHLSFALLFLQKSPAVYISYGIWGIQRSYGHISAYFPRSR